MARSWRGFAPFLFRMGMNNSRQQRKRAHRLGICVIALWLVTSATMALPPPVIYLIEPYLTKQVFIHFDTQANRAYTLQCTTSFQYTNGVLTATWSNMYFVPAFPFEGHYIVPDWRTNAVRFYRLMATP